MLKSMTGFGKCKCVLPDCSVSVEIRSINSKQLDLNLRLCNAYRELEPQIRSCLQKGLERGKIELSLSVDKSTSESANDMVINMNLAKTYYRQVQELAEVCGSPLQDPIRAVLRMPNICEQKSEEVSEKDREAVLATVEECIRLVNQSRAQEGIALEKDFLLRVGLIEKQLKETEVFEQNRVDAQKERILKNLESICESDKIDKSRFEQEMIYYLEKLDVTEEKVRLVQHCLYFRETLKEASSGRKLAFITQEIGREINTLGSKANEVNMQKIVVQMKDELEKIKEQLSNVL